MVNVCRGGPTGDCGNTEWHSSHVVLPEDHIEAAVAIMASGLPFEQRLELHRRLAARDGEPFVCSPRDARVGDRVRAAGYLGDDGWAEVVLRDDARRLIRVRFDDGEETQWDWGRRGGGAAVVCQPGA